MHVIEATLAAPVGPVIVVTGHDAAAVAAALVGLPVHLVDNPDHDGGMSTSLRAGLAAVPAAADGAMVLLGDMPLVTPALIATLAARFDPAAGAQVVVPVRAGRRGNPVVWGRCHFPALMQLAGDKGGRDLIDTAAGRVEVEVAEAGAFIDVDTPQALATLAAKAAMG